jgi:hypothetical protein
MKKLLRGCLLAVAMGVLIVNVASAGPLKVDITAATGWNPSTDSLHCNTPADSTARVWTFDGTVTGTPGEEGYFLSVFLLDTVASAATAASFNDSAVVRIVRRAESVPDSTYGFGFTQNPKGWASVYTFALTHITPSAFPITKHIPLDSLAVYPLTPAGEYGVIFMGGRDEPGHHFGKAWKIRVLIETLGKS